MRATLMALTIAVLLTAAPAAISAPTCQDVNGATARCGTPGAMPVGWTPPGGQSAEVAARGRIDADEIFALVAIIGGLFALIALMPRFDNAHGNRWDRQEGDD